MATVAMIAMFERFVFVVEGGDGGNTQGIGRSETPKPTRAKPT